MEKEQLLSFAKFIKEFNSHFIHEMTPAELVERFEETKHLYVDKNCMNCKFYFYDEQEEPCNNCNNDSNWKVKSD